MSEELMRWREEGSGRGGEGVLETVERMEKDAGR